MKLTAIIPKRSPVDPKRSQDKIDDLLKAFIVEAQREMSEYPPWRPWKNPPTSGPHAGGRRTGDYGRGWQGSAITKQTQFEATIANPVRYAIYVGGKKGEQAGALAARGWQSVSDVGPRIVAALRSKGKLKIAP